jgi:hypothetical protein
VAVDASGPLQTAIYNALTGDATLMAAIEGVYDFVPQDSAYPYVTIGDDDYKWWGAMGLDGGEYVVQIDGWARAEGRLECKNIMKLVADVLHDGVLTVASNTFISMRLQFQQVLREADGFTYHGVQQYKVYLHE